MPGQPKLQITILRAGISQKELARRCGFPAPRVSDYIHGVRAIPPRHLILMCKVLQCSPEDIMGHSYTELDLSRGG